MSTRRRRPDVAPHLIQVQPLPVFWPTLFTGLALWGALGAQQHGWPYTTAAGAAGVVIVEALAPHIRRS